MLSETRLRIPVTLTDHAEGDASAALTLVQYGDYECVQSGRAYYIVKRLQGALGRDLRFVFRNFPRSEHPHALNAAKAAESANYQGKFWRMHDRLFEHANRLTIDDLFRHAVAVGLDLETFVYDMGSEPVARRILADTKGGAESGVAATPAYFINGLRYEGNGSFDSLEGALRTALEAVKAGETKKAG